MSEILVLLVGCAYLTACFMVGGYLGDRIDRYIRSLRKDKNNAR